LALCLSVLAAPRAGAAELISIQGVTIAADEYVAGFDLATDGLYVLAVCHILGDWTVTVYDGHPPDSRISGYAHHGASSLPASALDRLKQLVLVAALPAGAGSEGHRPSITGVLSIGQYGDGRSFRTLNLRPANIGWEHSEACPSPYVHR